MDVEGVIVQALTPSEYISLFPSKGRRTRRVRHRSDLETLKEILGRPSATCAAPEWVTAFRQIVESLENTRTYYQTDLELAANLAYPVLRHTWKKLSQSVNRSGAGLLSATAKSELKGSLLSRLSFTGRHAAEWLRQVLLNTSGLVDDSRWKDPEQLFAKVIFAEGVEPATLRFLEHHPALARLWALQTVNWTRYVAGFLRVATTFARMRLSLPSQACVIRSIEADRSDLHSGNRSVMRVRFADKSVWFYKPRSGKHEEAWFSLLRWINQRGFPTHFAIFDVISGSDHCWMQGVSHRPCWSKKEAAQYYFRAGALLCLVHFLRGVDFHAGNIVAYGSHPVFVDCETLLHPNTRVPRQVTVEEESVLRTGMLPIRQKRVNYRVSDSVSAFGRNAFGPHTVRVRNQTVFTSEFIDALIAGFQEMHQFLQQTKRRAIVGCKPLFGLPIRHIHRPTEKYYAILDSSLSVAALHSGRERHATLLAACRAGSSARSNIRKEVAALQDADIPIFRGQSAKPRRNFFTTMMRDVAVLRSSFDRNIKTPRTNNSFSMREVAGRVATCISRSQLRL